MSRGKGLREAASNASPAAKAAGGLGAASAAGAAATQTEPGRRAVEQTTSSAPPIGAETAGLAISPAMVLLILAVAFLAVAVALSLRE